MFKRVVFTAVLATGLFAISAAQRMDDPYPCPDCDPSTGNGPDQLTAARAALRMDDPYPCPDCDPSTGNGPDQLVAGL